MAPTSDTAVNLGPELETGIWVGMAIATLIVLVRVFAKVKIKQFYVDDVVMIFAMMMAIASTVFLTLSIKNGFGQNLGSLSFDHLVLVLKYIAIQVPLITISTGLARAAFALYLLGILGRNKNYRIVLWVAMLLQLACNIISGILPLSICRNVNILWDPTVKTTCGNIADVVKFAYFQSSVNSATDLFLAVFPTVVFWNLNLKFSMKISLIALMGLGIFAMIASIIKTTKLNEVPSVTNLGPGGAVELIRWGYVENLVIIITSSVPCIRPLIISSVRKLSSGVLSRSYELGDSYGGNRLSSKNTSSRNHERYIMKNNETDSIERILGSDNYHPDPDVHSPQVITKHVGISVVSEEERGRRV